MVGCIGDRDAEHKWSPESSLVPSTIMGPLDTTSGVSLVPDIVIRTCTVAGRSPLLVLDLWDKSCHSGDGKMEGSEIACLLPTMRPSLKQ
jgi:hypothetical protein